MIKLIHPLIEAIFLLCPVIMLTRAIWFRINRNQRRPLRQLRLTFLAGMGMGVVICVLYAATLGGRLVFTQVLLTCYLALSLMLLLQLFDRTLWLLSRFIFRLHDSSGPAWWYRVRAVMGLLVRMVAIFAIGFPYVLAVVMTYRPKVISTGDPASLFNWKFSPVSFPAVDGVGISGWWIPASTGESRRTVLLCPGSGGGKASQLFLVKKLVPAGYNVLVFDFRAHGESAGQFCGFGALERSDVLGAIRWLQATHPAASHRVAGLGVSTGAAALLSAAADPSREGQSIGAIAVYDTFDRLDNETDALVQEFVPAPLSWCVRKFGLSMAGWQVGANLASFSPADAIRDISARPLLIIHGTDDELIPFDQGKSLYESADSPKMNFWIERCDHDNAIRSKDAADFVKKCFDSVRTRVRTII